MKSLPTDLPAQEIIASLSQFGSVDVIPENDERKHRRIIARGIIHLIFRNLIATMRTGRKGRGDSKNVKKYYESDYAMSAAEAIDQYAHPQKLRLFRLGNRSVVRAEPRAVAVFMTNCLGGIINACEPETICEVGCGQGRNLFYLANRLPTIRCAGFDLSENAIKTAQELQRMDQLPSSKFGEAYGLGKNRLENIKKIDFRVGSAFSLPSADKSFDLVFTSAALEQMHTNIDKALSELRRVARYHVLMMEPFVDGNDVLGRIFLWSQNYFRMRAADLAKHGLEPIRIWSEFPRKQTFGYSFVLCRVKP